MTEENNEAPAGQAGEGDADVVAAAVAEGNNEAPDWLLPKYMSDERTHEQATQEQAKAYGELQTKFGAFTGAPDNYEVSLSDAVKEAGGELDMEDGLLVEAMAFAKDSNMSNDSFNKLVDIFQMSQIAEDNALTEQRTEEMKALGANAEARINNINAWASKNMSEENVAGLQEVATTAAGVKAIEQLISRTRNAPVSVDNQQAAPAVSMEDLKSAQFKLDKYGGILMASDPEYRLKVEKMYQERFGTEDHQILVGG